MKPLKVKISAKAADEGYTICREIKQGDFLFLRETVRPDVKNPTDPEIRRMMTEALALTVVEAATRIP